MRVNLSVPELGLNRLSGYNLHMNNIQQLLDIASSAITVVVFVIGVGAYLVSNTQKRAANIRKIRYVAIFLNKNIIKDSTVCGIKLKGPIATVDDLPNLYKEFARNDGLLEAYPGVAKELDKYKRLAAEITFFDRLENLAIAVIVCFLLIAVLLARL